MAPGRRCARQQLLDLVADEDLGHELVAEGVGNLHYVNGEDKLASLGEAQYDASAGIGVHPSQIPHHRIAEFVAANVQPMLLEALKRFND